VTIVPQVRQFKGSFLEIRDVSGGVDTFRRKVVVLLYRTKLVWTYLLTSAVMWMLYHCHL